MPTTINIVFTGICTFLTGMNGVPTEVVVPNAGGHIPIHATWIMLDGTVEAHGRAPTTMNGKTFYFIQSEELSIGEAIKETSVTVDASSWPYVVDLQKLVKKNKLKKAYTTKRVAKNVNAVMAFTGGKVSAPYLAPYKWKLKHEDGNVVIDGCIAQGVEIKMTTDAEKVTLKSAKITDAADQMPDFTITPTNNVVNILIGNTTLPDIVPPSPTPTPAPEDKHFAIYYDLFAASPGKRYFPALTNVVCGSLAPSPAKTGAATPASPSDDKWADFIRFRLGGGGNCPPTRTLKID